MAQAERRMHQVSEVLGEKRLRRLSELHGMLGRFSSRSCFFFGPTTHWRKAKGDGFLCFLLLVSPAVLKWDFSCTWHLVNPTHFSWKPKTPGATCWGSRCDRWVQEVINASCGQPRDGKAKPVRRPNWKHNWVISCWWKKFQTTTWDVLYSLGNNK